MIANIRYILPSERLALRLLIDKEADRFEDDVSSYSSRSIFWLKGQPSLSTQNLGWSETPEQAKPALELEAMLDTLMGFKATYLIARGNTGIRPHRDSTYAAETTTSLHLGKPFEFLYASQRQGSIDTTCHPKDGAIFDSNSKHLHGSNRDDSDGYGIFGWTLSERFKAAVL